MTTSSASVRHQVSEAEWEQRVQLAAAYRLTALYGWDDLIFTHISARVPGPEHHFLINPYGMMFDEITASSLVKVDLDGNKVLASDHDINPAGFTIHSAVHAAREDAGCVLHTHTRAGVGVSAQKAGVLPISQHALRFHERLAYHDFEGPAVDEGERERLVADLGSNDAMILRNHGLLSWGETLPLAFAVLWTLQRACEVQLATQSMGAPLPVPEAIAAACTRDSFQFDPARGAGQDVFDALVRQVDRVDGSWRQ